MCSYSFSFQILHSFAGAFGDRNTHLRIRRNTDSMTRMTRLLSDRLLPPCRKPCVIERRAKKAQWAWLPYDLECHFTLEFYSF